MLNIRFASVILSWTFANFAVICQDNGRCECVPGGSCNDRPYGSLALDISVLGIFPPCPIHGHVRCCSREGLELVYAGMLKAALTQQPVRVQVKPVDLPPEVTTVHSHTDDECGCIPRGICRSSLTRQTSECNGHLELCCIHDFTHSNVLVSIFQDEQVQSTTPPAPVFRPRPQFSEQDEQQPQTELDLEGLPCLIARDCDKVYGYDPLDIAKYGVLAPCSKRGFHRCVQPKDLNFASNLKVAATVPTRPTTTTLRTTPRTTTVWTTTTAPPRFDAINKMRLVPCIPETLCQGTLYNPGNGVHLARFGVLPRCHVGMSRCIVEVDIRVDSPQPKIRLPFFTKEVMKANFDLPVFTGDRLREDMHRFFDGKLHDHKKNHERNPILDDTFAFPTQTDRTTQFQQNSPQEPIEREQIDLNENLRVFLAQLQQKTRVDVPRGAQQVQSTKSSVPQHSTQRPVPASSRVQTHRQSDRVPELEQAKINPLLELQRLVSGKTQPVVVVETTTKAPVVQLKAPGGSRRIVKVDKGSPKAKKKPPPSGSKSLRNFFSRQKRPSLFQRKKEKKQDKQPGGAEIKETVAQGGFPNFQDVDASVDQDEDGNVLISGGRKVFHLPPGIAPPPTGAVQPGAVSLDQNSKSQGNEKPVFFDPSDAPHVAEVLKNSKSSVIQVHTDDNQKMVLNVKNDQLLGILQALQSALDAI